MLFQDKKYVINKVNKGDKQYPAQLRQLSCHPQTLYCIGNVELLDTPLVYITGEKVMDESLVLRTTNLLSELSSDFHIINMAKDGVECFSLTEASFLKARSIILLPWTINLDDYDEFRPLIDDVIDNGGLVVSLYADDEEVYINNYSLTSVLAALARVSVVVNHGVKNEVSRV